MSTLSPTSDAVYEIRPPSATTEAGGTGRFTRLWRGPDTDPRWARPGLLGLLMAAAVLYLWDLSASGWANSFYAAAVQAGTKSWKAMLFGSLDAGNAITVDKPPASLWVMEISGRLFGFDSWTMLAPQALMGVATCGVVYMAVKRVLTRTRDARTGAAFGLLAAAALMVTPVAVLMFKFNNPDALLVLLMTLSVYAVVRAMEHGSTRWLVLAGTLIGFAFLTKTLQAFLILPALTAVYLALGPGRFPRRLWQIGAAGLAIVVSAGWWVAIVQFWPASSRPYIGGSQDNSFLNLTFGYNGFGRLTGNETGSVGGGGAGGGGFRRTLEGAAGATGTTGAGGTFTAPNGQTFTFPGGGNGGGGGPRGGGGGGFSSGTGIGRMFDSEIGSQISWLIPAALVLFVFGLWAAGRARRTDHARAALLAWGLSLLSTAAVFSYMKGIFHPYYTIALAPLIAITIGLGGGMLWARRSEPLARIGLAGAVGLTAWWSFHLLGQTPDWYSWLRYVIAVGGAAGAALLLAGPGWLRKENGAQGAQGGEGAQGLQNAPVGAVPQPGWVPVEGATADGSSPGAQAAPAAVEAGTPAAAGTRIKGLRLAAVTIGVGAALLGPAAYAVATTGTGHSGSIPSAGPSGAGFGGGPGGFGGPGGNRTGRTFPGGGQGFMGGAPGGQTGQTGTGGQSSTGGQTGGTGGNSTGGQGGFGSGQGGFGGGPGGQTGTGGQTGGTGGQTGTTTGGQGTTPGGTTGGTTGNQGGGMGNLLDASTPGTQIQALLKQNASSYRWVAAAIGAQNAAGYQLATGDPVMAIGGFNGSDPSPTLAQFQAYVAQHKIHYYIAGGVGGQANGGADEGGSIGTWVAAHYKAQTVDNVTIYDLSSPTS
jgi:4-amino-4-deoxy-L-arabinose transferase-like glycosyltransferase